jgi:hypothetical protein
MNSVNNFEKEVNKKKTTWQEEETRSKPKKEDLASGWVVSNNVRGE